MTLTQCPSCGRVYNLTHLERCPRCGAKLEELRPWVMGIEGAERPEAGAGAEESTEGGAGAAEDGGEGGEPRRRPEWQPSQAVEDVVLEYRNKLNENPDDHTTRYSLAYAYMLARRWETGAEHLEQVIAALPEFDEAHYRLAICLLNVGDRRRALEAARKASELQPENVRYQQLLERLEAASADDG